MQISYPCGACTHAWQGFENTDPKIEKNDRDTSGSYLGEKSSVACTTRRLLLFRYREFPRVHGSLFLVSRRIRLCTRSHARATNPSRTLPARCNVRVNALCPRNIIKKGKDGAYDRYYRVCRVYRARERIKSYSEKDAAESMLSSNFLTDYNNYSVLMKLFIYQ